MRVAGGHYTAADMYALLASDQLTRDPGARYDYSNLDSRSHRRSR